MPPEPAPLRPTPRVAVAATAVALVVGIVGGAALAPAPAATLAAARPLVVAQAAAPASGAGAAAPAPAPFTATTPAVADGTTDSVPSAATTTSSMGSTATGDTASGTTTDSTTTDSTSTGDISTGDSTSGDTTSGDTTSGDTTSGDSGSGSTGTQDTSGTGDTSTTDSNGDATATPPHGLPAVGHVWIVGLPGASLDQAFGAGAVSPYLAGLRPQGTLLQELHGVGHGGLTGLVALLSGQGPTPEIQAGCADGGADIEPGVVRGDDPRNLIHGSGCRFPATVPTLLDQLTGAGRAWRVYEDLPEGANGCAVPPLSLFHTLADDPACGGQVAPLTQLATDVATKDSTPTFSYVTATFDELPSVVDPILASPAYADDGVLLVAPFEGAPDDRTTPRFDVAYPNLPAGAGGGGKTGGVLLSPFATPGATVVQAYDQFSLLATIEDLFGLDRLGYAQDPARLPFGRRVLNASNHPTKENPS